MARPRGEYLAYLKSERVRKLRLEGFTDREIAILVDRRISSRGVRRLRRERARELKGLTIAEKVEWALQNDEFYNEHTMADDLRRVSPDD